MSETRVASGIRKLTGLPAETPAVVAKVKLSAAEVSRLEDLGLRLGSTVRVLEGMPGQSVLLAVGDGRIGVNWGVADKIYVH